MSLAQRTISSIGWNSVSNLIRVVLLFGRSVLLARLLEVETFGVYKTADVIIILSLTLFHFGLHDALVYRHVETEDEEQAATAHFTLILILTAVWYLLVVGYALLWADGVGQTTLILMATAAVCNSLTLTGRHLLVRQVAHQRIAVLGTIGDVLSVVVAVSLAWMGFELWALISTNFVTANIFFVGLYVWQPVWRPSVGLSSKTVRYFLHFGFQNGWNNVLIAMLDRLDDLWTSLYLGNVALGLYSRAYTFAAYPRRVLALPINRVALGTYAELATDRQRLSQAFFQINALLVRTGFAFAGILALIAPEFIRLLIGEKWLPFLDTFRLMLVFTLLDPLKLTIAYLFTAVGRPLIAVRARIVQVVVLGVSLFLLGSTITGVALAVDIMLVVGICLMLFQARRFVDFSMLRLFFVPMLGLGLGLAGGRLAIEVPGVVGSDWRTASVKTAVFVTVYALTLLATERKLIGKFSKQIIELMKKNAQ